jgi:NRPS condensation-like uncharacterized protein
MTASADRPATSVALNLLDELYLNLDRPDEPWGVHFEVHVTGRVDPTRLAGAIGAAARRHPIARARLASWRRSDLGYRWEIPDELDHVPLTIVAADDEHAVAAARERLFAASPALEAAPPFEVVLARGPDDDSIMLNLHHGAGDGMGAVRLMRSVLRAYAGGQDPVPQHDALAVRDIRALAGAASIDDRLARARALARHTARQVAPATRLARHGRDARPGYGFELIPFSVAETRVVADHRTEGATVNDVLLAALAVAIRRWNAEHGRGVSRIALTMPVNLRPAAWRTETLANFAAYVTVSLTARETRDLARAVAATATHTRRVKRERLAGMVVDLLAASGRVPVGVKRRLPELIAMTGDVVVDTASMSNLGVLDALPVLDDAAGRVDAVWFSPPSRMPLGAAFGAVTLAGRLHVALRHRHPQLDRAGAKAFARLYHDVLLG